MTQSQQAYRSAREENEQAYNNIGQLVLAIKNSAPDMSIREIQKALDKLFWELGDLKPYLFPETKEVNY
jgi:hypothetical protein